MRRIDCQIVYLFQCFLFDIWMDYHRGPKEPDWLWKALRWCNEYRKNHDKTHDMYKTWPHDNWILDE